jgi:ribose transport system permease protein
VSEITETVDRRIPWQDGAAWRRLFRERPIVPLLVLLGLLVVISQLARPGIVTADWASVILRASVPLAILAGCQTLTMLTGGIDLSVGAVASMASFIVASLVASQGLGFGILASLLAAGIAGLVTGIGVGVFRVHPLIMTLGMSLVVLGLANAYQLQAVQTSTGVPPAVRTIGSDRLFGVLPYSLIVFVPVAFIVLGGLRGTGYGRLLYAIGDNPIAARLSGARSWQVLIVLYVISALLAAIAGILIAGLTNVASITLADTYVLPSVAAAVIGGTSILGGRGGYGGTIVGALILTVTASLLSSLGFPEAVRQVLYGIIIVAVAAAYTRVIGETSWARATRRRSAGTSGSIWAGPTSRRSSPNATRTHGGSSTASRSRRRPRPAPTPWSAGSSRWVRGRWGGSRTSPRSASGSPACTTLPRGRPASSSTSPDRGPACRWPDRSATPSGCPRRSSTTRGPSVLPSCGSAPPAARRR